MQSFFEVFASNQYYESESIIELLKSSLVDCRHKSLHYVHNMTVETDFYSILLINAGDDIQEIFLFVIFDRWGNEVFSANHFPADDPVYAWDGTMRDKHLNSAVFAYKIIAQFKDGRSEVRYGDVTLLK